MCACAEFCQASGLQPIYTLFTWSALLLLQAPTSEGEEAAEEADDMTCAICLERTPLIEIALVKGCEHQYCGELIEGAFTQAREHGLQPLPAWKPNTLVISPLHLTAWSCSLPPLLCAVNCILQWSLCKEWCPQCKHPFDYLLTHKQLDGTVTDFLTEESVVLLKRARWFEDYMRVRERAGKEGKTQHRLRQGWCWHGWRWPMLFMLTAPLLRVYAQVNSSCVQQAV